MSKTGKTRKQRPTDTARPLTVDDVWAFERVGAVALSPDGQCAVAAVTQYAMADNSATTHLWLLPTEDAAPRQLTRCGGKDGQALWSPDGARIAFIAKREQDGVKDVSAQLYVIASTGGEARRVSNFAPGIESFKWMPDGRRLVFAAWVWPGLQGTAAQARAHKADAERKDSGYATSAAYYRYWDHNLPMGRVLHLHLLDLASGGVRDLFEGRPYELPRDGAGNEVYDVRPDGRRIAFVHDPAAQQMLGNRLALADVELRSGDVCALLDDAAWDFAAPRYSPDGRQLALLAAHTGAHHTAFSQLALLQSDGSWQARGQGWDHAVNAPLRWAADGRVCAVHRRSSAAAAICGATTWATAGYAVEHAGGWVQSFDVAAPARCCRWPPTARSTRHACMRLRPGDERRCAWKPSTTTGCRASPSGTLREVDYTGALGRRRCRCG